MKSRLFFLLIVALLGGSAYLIADKMGVEMPDISPNHTIAPYTEWDSLIRGNWDFRFVSESTYALYTFEGEIEYNDDHTFSRSLTVKYYHSPYGPEEKLDHLKIVGGGHMEGTWEIDTIKGAVVETIINCDIPNSMVKEGYKKEYNACTWFAQKGIFGNNKMEFSKMAVKSFSSNRIIYEGHNFKNDSDLKIHLKKSATDI